MKSDYSLDKITKLKADRKAYMVYPSILMDSITKKSIFSPNRPSNIENLLICPKNEQALKSFYNDHFDLLNQMADSTFPILSFDTGKTIFGLSQGSYVSLKSITGRKEIVLTQVPPYLLESSKSEYYGIMDTSDCKLYAIVKKIFFIVNLVESDQKEKYFERFVLENKLVRLNVCEGLLTYRKELLEYLKDEPVFKDPIKRIKLSLDFLFLEDNTSTITTTIRETPISKDSTFSIDPRTKDNTDIILITRTTPKPYLDSIPEPLTTNPSTLPKRHILTLDLEKLSKNRIEYDGTFQSASKTVFLITSLFPPFSSNKKKLLNNFQRYFIFRENPKVKRQYMFLKKRDLSNGLLYYYEKSLNFGKTAFHNESISLGYYPFNSNSNGCVVFDMEFNPIGISSMSEFDFFPLSKISTGYNVIMKFTNKAFLYLAEKVIDRRVNIEIYFNLLSLNSERVISKSIRKAEKRKDRKGLKKKKESEVKESEYDSKIVFEYEQVKSKSLSKENTVRSMIKTHTENKASLKSSINQLKNTKSDCITQSRNISKEPTKGIEHKETISSIRNTRSRADKKDVTMQSKFSYDFIDSQCYLEKNKKLLSKKRDRTPEDI